MKRIVTHPATRSNGFHVSISDSGVRTHMGTVSICRATHDTEILVRHDARAISGFVHGKGTVECDNGGEHLPSYNATTYGEGTLSVFEHLSVRQAEELVAQLEACITAAKRAGYAD